MSNKDSDSDYSQLPTALRFALRQFSKGLRTAIPAHIVEYDAPSKRAVILPAIQFRMTDNSLLDRAPIGNVPVIHPAGGGYVLHFPLKAGDPVMLLFSERGIGEFKRAYGKSPPDLDSLLSEKDAVAIPAFGALTIAPVGSGVALQTEQGDVSIEVNKAGFVEIIATGMVKVTAPSVIIEGNVSITGNVTINGDVATVGGLTNNSKDVGSGHQHSGIIPGGGTTGAPV